MSTQRSGTNKAISAARLPAKAPVAPGSGPAPYGEALPLPHERDESTNSVASAPDAVIEQAKRDLDAGMVDTDMRATPGLDARRRTKLVPGPGGKPTGT